MVPFAAIWFLFGLTYTFLEKGILGDTHVYPATGVPYYFEGNVLIGSLATISMGFMVGFLEVRVLNQLFSKKAFLIKAIYKTLIYILIAITFLIITGSINNAVDLEVSIFDQQVFDNVMAFFSSFALWSVLLYIAIAIITSLFYLEVSNNLGLGVLRNFATGKYHTPIQEERVFMFVDMKSSTTIAEKLGHVRYFELLKEYFADLSGPIIEHSGEIYQYVGDEIVISWKATKDTASPDALQCFFEMKKVIQERAECYETAFGLAPTFKAGVHVGKVTAGEIGVIKKEITYSGDILNATARIQGLCNTFKSEILVSQQLIDRLPPSNEFEFIPKGETELRGKDEKVNLFTVMPTAV